MVLAAQKNVLAVALLVIGYLGQQLVWFQGDKTTGTDNNGRPHYPDQVFFNIFVANILFALAIALEGVSAASNVAKTAGALFFIVNVEWAVCELPPAANALSPKQFVVANERRTAYVGGVVLLITTFLGFALSFLKLISIPAGLGGRIGSIRGLTFLIAVLTSLVTSFIAFSYDFTCPSTSSLPSDIPKSNARPILFAWVFLSAVLVGDAESVNLSVFLASIGVLMWKPIFDSRVDSADDKVHDNWRAQETIAFSGFVILLLGTVLDKFLKGEKKVNIGLQTVVDFAILGLGIAGAVSAYDKSTVLGSNPYLRKIVNYQVSYAIVITVLNLVAGVLGLTSLSLISTFFSIIVLDLYDNGSTTSTHDYFRGGLQLCQAATLLSTLVKVFPVAKIQEGVLSKIVDDKNNRVAAFFLLAWLTVSAIYVPTGYSKYAIIAIITFGALTQGCKDWARTTFFIVTFWGVVQTFPLAVQISFEPHYVKAIIFLASVAFTKLFAQDFQAAGAPAFGATSEDAPKEAPATATEPSA